MDDPATDSGQDDPVTGRRWASRGASSGVADAVPDGLDPTGADWAIDTPNESQVIESTDDSWVEAAREASGDDEFTDGPFADLNPSSRRKRLLVLLGFLVLAGVGVLIFSRFIAVTAEGFGNVIQNEERRRTERAVDGVFRPVDTADYTVDMASCKLSDAGILKASGTVSVDPSLEDGVYRVELFAVISLGGDPVEVGLSDNWNSVDAATTDWSIADEIVSDFKPGDFELSLSACDVSAVSRKVRQS